MKTPMVLLLSIVIALLAAVIIESPVTESATDAATQTTAVTSDGAGAGSMTLSAQHWYSDTSDMTVTSVLDGDVTGTATLGTDRRTISITGLTASTSSNITATYLGEISDSTIAIILKVVPFLMMIGALVGAFGSTFMGAKSAMGAGDMGAGTIGTVIVVFIGVVLIPIVLSFTSLVSTTYSVAPEFIGVTTILPLVSIGYVLALLATGIGGLAPRAKSFLGSN